MSESNAVKIDKSKGNSKENLDETNKKTRRKKAVKSTTTNEKEQEASSSKTFDILQENFPDLSTAKNAGLTDLQEQFKIVAPNGTQLINESKLVETSKVSASTAAKTSGQKKSRQPIQFEFASMISALEVGTFLS